MMPEPDACRGLAQRWLAAAFALLPGLAAADSAPNGEWASAPAQLRLGFETVKLPADESMGLVGATYLVEVRPGLCLGPAVYGAATGQRGGLFVVGAEAALCTTLVGPLSVQAGFFAGGGGGGGDNATVGGGLMLRTYADLLWDFGGYRAGLSVSNVRFPSGQIDSNQVGLVFAMDTEFNHLPTGRAPVAFEGTGRTGVGFDRVLAVVGVYRLGADTRGTFGTTLGADIGIVGARFQKLYTPNFYAGIEASAAASGGAAGYAEALATLGMQWPVDADRWTLGGRVALGMGGGGHMPVGGGLLAKAAIDATLRLTPELSLNLEGGWVHAPQGSLSSPLASLALSWDLDHPRGQTSSLVREEFAGGVETYLQAARTNGPPQNLENVTFKFNRFLGESFYVTGQVQSAYAGDAGAFSVGLVGAGAQAHFAQWFMVGAELLAGAAGGGGVATGSGAIVKPMAYAGLDLTPGVSLRLGAGRVKAVNGPLDSTVVDLTLAYSFGVASRR